MLSAKYYDPFALVFVAIPLETFVHSLRTVVGLTGIAVLRVLMQELRAKAAGTTLARAQVSTLRERLLKLGARVERSVRRIIVHLPTTFAYRNEWRRIALALGAETPLERTERSP